MNSLKVALVTGGARRVGKSICLGLHGKGFNVVIHCNSSIQEAKELMDKLNCERKDSAMIVVKNLSQNILETSREIVDEAAAKWGQLDCVVNNASNFISNNLNDLTPHDLDASINVNLKAPIFIMQAAAEHLKKTKGSIVNMSDLVGLKPKDTHFSHAISKAGLISATLNAALTLAPEVRVNVIAPGCVDWPEVDQKIFNDKEKQNWLNSTPLRKLGTPEDVASLVCFLSSEEANFITGQIMNLDGGRSLNF